MLNNRDKLYLGLFFIVGFFSRLPLVEKMQSHWDGPQYSIAIIKYSLEQQTPAPPGYPLYIFLGNIFHLLTPDLHFAILLVSVLFSGLGAAAFYLCGKLIYNSKVGIIAALLFLSGPTFFYFGLTAYPYIVTPVMAILLATVIYLIVFKKKHLGILLGMVFALDLGIRPQELFFLTPLVILGFCFLNFREKKLGIVSFSLVIGAWLIPFIMQVGGLTEYMHQLKIFAAQGAVSGFSILKIEDAINTMIKGFFLTFGISLFFLVIYFWEDLKNKETIYNNKKLILFWASWLLPGMIFSLLIRTDHAGHQMAYLAGFVILISYAIYKTASKINISLSLIMIILVLFNLMTFFRNRDIGNKKEYVPTSFHYSEIRKNDLRMQAKMAYVTRNFDPASTLIVTLPDLWRPYMYYLKSYTIYEFDGVVQTDSRFKYIFRFAKNWDFVEKQ